MFKESFLTQFLVFDIIFLKIRLKVRSLWEFWYNWWTVETCKTCLARQVIRISVARLEEKEDIRMVTTSHNHSAYSGTRVQKTMFIWLTLLDMRYEIWDMRYGTDRKRDTDMRETTTKNDCYMCHTTQEDNIIKAK